MGFFSLRRPAWFWLAALIGALTIALYRQVGDFQYVHWDDNFYIFENPMVLKGLTWEGFAWAWQNADHYFMPLTFLSFMLEVELFGLDSGISHWINLLLHMGNVLLLGFFLREATGAFWKSLLVAAFFAVHPQHVESVAWVSERKEVLAGCFGFLALIQYLRYVHWRRLDPQSKRGKIHFMLVHLWFLVTLQIKPMWISMPFLLLLLDWWPLARHEESVWLLIREKLPMFLFGLFYAVLTVLTFVVGDRVLGYETMTMGARLANLAVAYPEYLGKTILPILLAGYYPHPGNLMPAWQWLWASGFLAIVSLGVIWQARRRPYLLVGWFWFLGSLIPVSGVFNGGALVAMADRWIYLPHVGVFMAAVWGAEGMRWPGVLRLSPPAWTMLAIGFLGFWSWLTWLQTATWRNTQTLWSHATLAIPGNHPVHWMLASYYLSRRQFESAYQESLAAYRIRPQYPRYAASVGYALINMRKYPQALFAYSLVLANPTTDTESLVKIGTVVMLYSPRDAQPYFARAEQQGKAKPDQHYYEAMFNHGLTLTAHGRMEEAESRFSRLFQGKPELIRGRCQAALALFEPATAKGLARFPLTADASEHFSNFFPGAYAMIAKHCRPALEGPGG